MTKVIFTTVFLLNLLVSSVVLGQDKVDLSQVDIKPLRIGDSIPEQLWHEPLAVINDGDSRKTITLNDYRGRRLILLDFWTTYCTACLKLIPKIESIAHEIGSDFQPIPITPQNYETINDFLKAKELDFWSVVDGAFFKDYFPMYSVPHEVWIKDGQVFAITGGSAISRNTVEGVISGSIQRLPEKVHNTSYDENLPLLIDGNGGNAPDLIYHSVFSGYLPGVVGSIQGQIGEDNFYFRYINQSPISLYRNIAWKYNPDLILKNRTVFDDVILDTLANLNLDNAEQQKHLYGYELVVPLEMKVEMKNMAWEDFNRFFSKRYGFTASIRKREVDCWVLRISNQDKLPFSSGEELMWEKHGIVYQQNSFIKSIIVGLNRNFDKETHFIIDETGLENTVNLQFWKEEGGFKKTKAYLEKNGFEFSLEKREMEVLEFSKANEPTE